MPPSVADELLRALRRQEMQGRTTLELSPGEWREFRMAMADDRGAPARDRRPAARAARPERRADRRRSSRPPVEAGERRADRRRSSRPPRSDGPLLTPAPDVRGLDLAQLSACVASCRACPLHAGRTQTVFADGDGSSGLMFIGEGPGADEDRQGVPFVGRAGQLLTRMIQAMQLRREEVYIANIVKCRAPGNRNPNDDEAAACMRYLKRQIALIEPQVIVLLGAVPLRCLLNKTGINASHGTWFEYEGIPVMPTFHPAYLLRLESKKRDAWDDLKKVMRKMGKDPAATQARRRDAQR